MLNALHTGPAQAGDGDADDATTGAYVGHRPFGERDTAAQRVDEQMRVVLGCLDAADHHVVGAQAGNNGGHGRPFLTALIGRCRACRDTS